MKYFRLLLTVAPLAVSAPALADSDNRAAAVVTTAAAAADAPTAAPAAPAAKQQSFSTGVARARDILDSAISTSTLDGETIRKIGTRSLSEVFRYIPGVRSESYGGEGNASISIRGLPIALGGSKFLQIQEDGLPVLEFGDVAFFPADNFLRADLTVAGIQAIRGGSASTFASNSPGGIVNIISHTGEVEGGAVELTTGLDYDTKRVDFDYGSKISDSLRFNLGGFYRTGEGPLAAGFDAYKGGQVKFNLTKTFTGGYFRVYAKVLDDRTPYAAYQPLQVGGTVSAPTYTPLAGFDPRRDSLLSTYIPSTLSLDQNNRLARFSTADGQHSKATSLGFEGQFTLDDWSITEKFRRSALSGNAMLPYNLPNDAFGSTLRTLGTPAAIATTLAGLNRTAALSSAFTYANGPNAGSAVASDALLGLMTYQNVTLDSLDNITNDLRASKVWDVGQGKLTGTIGFYKANQEIKSSWLWTSVIQAIRGNGTSTLVNASITTPGGVLSSQDGYWGYGTAFIGNTRRYVYDLSYDVNAPYGSINYAVGKLAIGASVRYDFGRARGAIYGSDLGNGRVGVASVDINGDSVISNAETRVSVVPLGSPAPVRYNYDYLSYSAGVNYRVSPDFSAFARYSKGARANADRILYAYVTRPTALYYVSPTDGSLVRPDAAYDTVKQAEGGVKFRKSDLSLFVTGFWAETKEHNISLDRTYRAYGAEFEGAYRKGIFNLTAGATWTHARIVADAIAASNIGHTPKHQADLIFQFSPYVETEKFTLGTNVVGTTWSYATDLNGLRMPGYVLVNAVAQYRPIPRVQVSLNANNLFNRLALLDIGENTIAPNNLVTAKVNQGRTISASLRFEF